MISDHDLPHFLCFVENAVATEVGGTFSGTQMNLIRRTARAHLDAQRGDLQRVFLLTREIADLRRDPAHRPEDSLQLHIIKTTKQLCEQCCVETA